MFIQSNHVLFYLCIHWIWLTSDAIFGEHCQNAVYKDGFLYNKKFVHQDNITKNYTHVDTVSQCFDACFRSSYCNAYTFYNTRDSESAKPFLCLLQNLRDFDQRQRCTECISGVFNSKELKC